MSHRGGKRKATTTTTKMSRLASEFDDSMPVKASPVKVFNTEGYGGISWTRIFKYELNKRSMRRLEGLYDATHYSVQSELKSMSLNKKGNKKINMEKVI